VIVMRENAWTLAAGPGATSPNGVNTGFTSLPVVDRRVSECCTPATIPLAASHCPSGDTVPNTLVATLVESLPSCAARVHARKHPSIAVCFARDDVVGRRTPRVVAANVADAARWFAIL
jgi:hypothetical protein